MLSKRATESILAALVVANLLLRFPRTPHEMGVDSFVFHGLTQTLIDFGHARWILTPLSYFGLYPLSHPSGPLFLLGSVSVMGGIQIEGSILVTDWIVSILGALGGFLLGWEFRRDSRFALLVATFFSLSPRFVGALMWEVPTRTMFTAMIPLLLFALIRLHRNPNSKHLALLGAVLLTQLAAHRLTVLMLLVILAYILTLLLVTTVRLLKVRYSAVMLSPKLQRATLPMVAGAFFVSLVSITVYAGVLESYSTGRLGSGSAASEQLLNLGISLTRSVGVLLPIAVVGAVALMRQRNKGIGEPMFLIVLLVMMPTLSLRQYTGFYIIAFFAVFMAAGMLALVRVLGARRMVAVLTASAILLGGFASTAVIVEFDTELESSMTSETYTGATWSLHQVQGTTISNGGLSGSRFFAITGGAYLPVGGATTGFQSPELLVFGFLNRSRLRIVQIPIDQLTIESDSPFVLLDVNAELDWARVVDTHYDAGSSRTYRDYDIMYALEDHSLLNYYTAYGNLYDSPYYVSIHELKYRVFINSQHSLWYVAR